jgi:hypothetical protein
MVAVGAGGPRADTVQLRFGRHGCTAGGEQLLDLRLHLSDLGQHVVEAGDLAALDTQHPFPLRLRYGQGELPSRAISRAW